MAEHKAAKDKGRRLLDEMDEIVAISDTRDLSPGERERMDRIQRGIDRSIDATNELDDEWRQMIVNAGRPGSRLKAVPGSARDVDTHRSADASHRGHDGGSNEPRFVYTETRRPATVERGRSFGEHELVRAHAEMNAPTEKIVVDGHGSLGNLVRAMTTTSGSAVVPTVWASQIIDRARNVAAVLQAGAQVIPMAAKQVQVGRLTGDPAAAFRAEGSTITASDPTFDNVTLDSKTMSALVVGSLEWFQDAPNVDEVVSDAIARAVALNIDLVALHGSITTGAGTVNLPTPPNPRGVLGALNAVAASSVLGAQANGTPQTALSYWNEIIDTLFTVRGFNEQPTGVLWNAKAAQQYAKAYDSTGQPIAMPTAVAEVPRLITNQIPSYTQGTMANRATDVFAGAWNQLLIGQRLTFTLQTLTERYAENGQVGIVAHWRGDVQPARPRAFSVFKAIQGG